ncbi:uncharacterized protein PHACADRAFT_85115 [Phanerochaete carnosa HHB-10118-sp]|uniref:Isochorismatase-like domain-containing protein n=1 Tax=Phanerochaete carnosa (strain HHB-10118-sp) TaxID=650164 RepID=K5VDN0_PHACS|nr:uncharacterized protein PHACADRAFT_85115 [Phanerochaete carnosa HHB-10118-sp]EKM61091.1 hypothetical protein PHACADRAFT_85115 [Phanerochaete carnosa HHB-10118-sp]
MTSTPSSLNGHGFVKSRPNVSKPTEYGNATDFWVEYPNGLVDLSRIAHLPEAAKAHSRLDEQLIHEDKASVPPLIVDKQWEVKADGNRSLRLSRAHTAIVIIDMQKNWGLTEHELTTIPPSLVRGFMKGGKGGFGSELPGSFGRLLMRNQYNSALYGPLQQLYEQGKAAGTDVWIHKNRMSALWGPQSALDLYLQENGITSLLFAGVNADQVPHLAHSRARGGVTRVADDPLV